MTTYLVIQEDISNGYYGVSVCVCMQVYMCILKVLPNFTFIILYEEDKASFFFPFNSYSHFIEKCSAFLLKSAS